MDERPTWSFLIVVLMIIVAVLLPIMGGLMLSYHKQEDAAAFKLACIQAHGTWTPDACVID